MNTVYYLAITRRDPKTELQLPSPLQAPHGALVVSDNQPAPNPRKIAYALTGEVGGGIYCGADTDDDGVVVVHKFFISDEITPGLWVRDTIADIMRRHDPIAPCAPDYMQFSPIGLAPSSNASTGEKWHIINEQTGEMLAENYIFQPPTCEACGMARDSAYYAHIMRTADEYRAALAYNARYYDNTAAPQVYTVNTVCGFDFAGVWHMVDMTEANDTFGDN